MRPKVPEVWIELDPQHTVFKLLSFLFDQEQIRLSKSCKFLHISEDPERSWIIFKSVRHPLKIQQQQPSSNSSPHLDNRGIASGVEASENTVVSDKVITDPKDVLVRFIIMGSRPLRFLEQLEVRKSVFGKTAQDADLR